METTKNYNQFKFHPLNRGLNSKHILDLVKSIKETGYIKSRSILINKDFEILDGQHRFEACKILDLPINYEITEGDSFKILIALNNKQKNWEIKNYVESYSKQNIDSYRKLEIFTQKYKLSFADCVRIFAPLRTAEIKAGKVFTPNANAENIALFIENCGLPFANKRNFIRAIATLYSKANPTQIGILHKKKFAIPECVSAIEYLTVFENIINHKKRGDNRITLIK